MALYSKVKSYRDIIQTLYNEIESFFLLVGGIPPQASELYDSTNWRYCSALNTKHKGKIGYLCSYLQSGNRPRVKIVIHNFAQGGQSVTFDSWAFEKEQGALPPSRPVVTQTKRSPAELIARERKAKKEAERKHAQFLARLDRWEQGSPDVQDHPYIQKKSIQLKEGLRRLDLNWIGFPLQRIDGDIQGIQCIDTNGKKLIYGKKKGCFTVLGDLANATRLYPLQNRWVIPLASIWRSATFI